MALFAGAGGGILGGYLLGWETVCAVEIDPYAAGILVARQNDGILPSFPVWDDIRTFDGRPWRGIVNVVSGGFPCVDISVAGKGAGIDGERSGLWREMARVVREVGPEYVFVENSPMLLTARRRVALLIQVVVSLFGRIRLRTIIDLRSRPDILRILGDLAEIGYDAEWCVLGADDAGAPHIRKRIWILAHAQRVWRRKSTGDTCQKRKPLRETVRKESSSRVGSGCKNVPNAQGERLEGAEPARGACANGLPAELREAIADTTEFRRDARRKGDAEKEPQRRESDRGGQGDGYGTTSWWSTEPDVGRVVDGVAARVDRLKAIGNGQVPAVAALAWRVLTNRG